MGLVLKGLSQNLANFFFRLHPEYDQPMNNIGNIYKVKEKSLLIKVVLES